MSESIETILSGREILKQLEALGTYVFHGSDNPNIEEMEPRQGYNHKDDGTIEKDGEPAVFASDRVDYAIFMALINSKNCPDGYRSSADSIRNAKGEVELRLSTTQNGIDQLNEKSEGYVYVFHKSLFEQRSRKTEFISLLPVKYVYKIKVLKEDLPDNISIIK
jgi:hypothetical protein